MKSKLHPNQCAKCRRYRTLKELKLKTCWVCGKPNRKYSTDELSRDIRRKAGL